jgi:hypothetical protein
MGTNLAERNVARIPSGRLLLLYPSILEKKYETYFPPNLKFNQIYIKK